MSFVTSFSNFLVGIVDAHAEVHSFNSRTETHSIMTELLFVDTEWTGVDARSSCSMFFMNPKAQPTAFSRIHLKVWPRYWPNWMLLYASIRCDVTSPMPKCRILARASFSTLSADAEVTLWPAAPANLLRDATALASTVGSSVGNSVCVYSWTTAGSWIQLMCRHCWCHIASIRPWSKSGTLIAVKCPKQPIEKSFSLFNTANSSTRRQLRQFLCA